MYEIKTKDLFKHFNSRKEMFDFCKYLAKSEYYDDSNKLVIGKIKHKTSGAAIEECVRLKGKMYSSLVDTNTEH